jgi:hypothetical protein
MDVGWMHWPYFAWLVYKYNSKWRLYCRRVQWSRITPTGVDQWLGWYQGSTGVNQWLGQSKGALGWIGGLDESKGAPGWTGGLDESKGALGWRVAWMNPRSTRVAGDLVDSKEHWGGRWLGWIQGALGWPVTWLIPKSTKMTGDLVESKEH